METHVKYLLKINIKMVNVFSSMIYGLKATLSNIIYVCLELRKTRNFEVTFQNILSFVHHLKHEQNLAINPCLGWVYFLVSLILLVIPSSLKIYWKASNYFLLILLSSIKHFSTSYSNSAWYGFVSTTK